MHAGHEEFHGDDQLTFVAAVCSLAKGPDFHARCRLEFVGRHGCHDCIPIVRTLQFNTVCAKCRPEFC
jgi:hypothetical protein